MTHSIDHDAIHIRWDLRNSGSLTGIRTKCNVMHTGLIQMHATRFSIGE